MKLFSKLCASIIITASLSSAVFAGTQKLAYITNDEDKETIDLIITTDSRHDITQVKFNYKNTKGKVYKTDTYEAAKAARGVVVYEKKGREIVKLSSTNFSSYNGGDIELNFLVNGITGKRANKYFDLSRDGDSWSLKVNRIKIKKMHFVSNKKAFVGTIGIKTIKSY